VKLSDANKSINFIYRTNTAPHDLSASQSEAARSECVVIEAAPALGSSSFITDATGYAVQHLQYLPFGETFVDQQNGYDSRYTFSAKEMDDETQYSYLGARYLDCDLSVFLSVDPDINSYPWYSPYGYVFGNPINFFDFNGQRPIHRIIRSNGSRFRVTLDDSKPQYFKIQQVGFLNRGLGSAYEREFGMSPNTSAILVRPNCSQEKPSSPQGTPSSYLDETVGNSNVTVSQIITDYLTVYNDVQLEVIGNMLIPNRDYQTTSGQRYNPQITPAQFAQDRADFVKHSYFNDNSSVNAYGRSTLGNNSQNFVYHGVMLKDFDKDPMGITLIWNFDNLNRRLRIRQRDSHGQRHSNVRYLPSPYSY